WGSLAIHATREYGCRVVSITLSEEQLRLARERVTEAGVAGSVDIRLCDYRQASGRFDRIVSVEMFEAVGYEYWGTFFRKCNELLKPGGRMLVQTITVPDERFDAYRRGFDWIRKYVFPGGLLPSVFEIFRAAENHSSLRPYRMEDIGLDYARTLRLWRERFLERLPEVRRLGFDERFVRMWEFYLASCEAAFSVRYVGDAQIEFR
ncbi:MAG: class I SAM-dependent methyltransferase, partial [Candidatus Binatia bacterium]